MGHVVIFINIIFHMCDLMKLNTIVEVILKTT